MSAWGDDFRVLTPQQFREQMTGVAMEMVDLLCRKRASYGPDNLTKFGEFGILVRTSDKLERLAHMHRQGIDVTEVGEDAEDAWCDLAGYSLLVLLIRITERAIVYEDVA